MFFSRDTRYVKFIAAEYCSPTVGLVLVCLILRENIYDMIIAKNVWRVHSSNSPWKYVLKHCLFCLYKTNENDKQINTINS